MRGDDTHQGGLFSYVRLEQRVPQDHPLRPIRKMVDRILVEMSPQFDGLYSAVGRPSIAPEKLLRAPVIQVPYTIRSERMLMEQLDYNLLFRWFVGLEMDDPVTVGADKAYDTQCFEQSLREVAATPHVAQTTTGRAGAIADRTTRHAGYRVSQRKRKLVEQVFGWMKTVGGLRKTRHRGVPLVEWAFTLTAAIYNLVRIRNLETDTG